MKKSYARMRLENITSLGSIPLVVISRRLSDPLSGASEIENRQFEQAWKELQAELAALSPRGTQIIAAKSQHYIQLTQPQM